MTKCRNQIERMSLAALIVSLSLLFFLITRSGFFDTTILYCFTMLASYFYVLKTDLRYLHLFLAPLLLISLTILSPFSYLSFMLSPIFIYLALLLRKRQLSFFLTLFLGAITIEAADILVSFTLLGLNSVSSYLDMLTSFFNDLSIKYSNFAWLFLALSKISLTILVVALFLYPFVVSLLAFTLILAIRRTYKIELKLKIPNLLLIFTILLPTSLALSSFALINSVPEPIKICSLIFLAIYLILSILLSLYFPTMRLMKKRKIDWVFFLIFFISFILSPLLSWFGLFFMNRFRLNLRD